MTLPGTGPSLRRQLTIVVLALAGVLAGAAARMAGLTDAAGWIWAATAAGALIPTAISIAVQLARREAGVDIIAVLAMGGALALGENLAGAILALMLASGRFLESFAASRAQRELSSLLERAPRVVHRYQDGALTSPSLDDVVPGDMLLVKPGEIVPVDGHVAGGTAVLDESALTGEALPAQRVDGEMVRSGVVNAGGPFDLCAIAPARQSTYAGIIRLVQEAQASKAPFTRLADRYALWFIPLTLAVSGGAWALSGEASRALAVLVLATPCPLILAVPVAIISGISRAARRGVIVKGGAVLEAMAGARVLLLDKTGTVTTGSMVVSEVVSFGSHGPQEILRMAAALDQVSHHVLAPAIVRIARKRGLTLPLPAGVREEAGSGIRVLAEGRTVALGRFDWVNAQTPHDTPPEVRQVRRRAALEGSTAVFV